MPALFPPWSNTALRLTLGVAAVSALAAPAGLMVYVRTPWNTGQFQRVDQPVEFDHRHHVGDDHIDCIYCHAGAETSRYAGVPASEVCMGCHAQIWGNSPLLESVRRSYFSGQPLPWNRVHDLGDFAYFDHAVHVQRGLGCVTCHGRVDQMARVEKVAPLTMQWCLDCHRSYDNALLEHGGESPAALSAWLENGPVRPAKASAGESGTSYEPMQGSLFEVDVKREITQHDSVASLTTCSTCHR
jgi:hypothetical protein